MKLTKAAAAAALCALCLSIAPAFAADKMGNTMGGMQDPMVGGHAMYAKILKLGGARPEFSAVTPQP